ncbi:MAG: hypothetical protein Q7S76_02210, partial [bacterium]|nr:hypothetical protein [bacterium]
RCFKKNIPLLVVLLEKPDAVGNTSLFVTGTPMNSLDSSDGRYYIQFIQITGPHQALTALCDIVREEQSVDPLFRTMQKVISASSLDGVPMFLADKMDQSRLWFPGERRRNYNEPNHFVPPLFAWNLTTVQAFVGAVQPGEIVNWTHSQLAVGTDSRVNYTEIKTEPEFTIIGRYTPERRKQILDGLLPNTHTAYASGSPDTVLE